MKKIMFTSLLIFLSTESMAGAFGAEWGWSYQRLKDAGAECQPIAFDDFNAYKCSKMPKGFSNVDFFNVIFDKVNGLQKIRMVGEDITGDPYGTAGKKRYMDYKNAISKKYGPAGDDLTIEMVGLSLYKDSDEFYECLKYSGCGYYTALWNVNTGGTINVQIKGSSRGTGWVQLQYEGPEWSSSLDRIRTAEAESDLDAL